MEENKCSLDLTILIPLFNEEESLPELHEWISRVVSKMGVSYEILFINDGSTDGSWKVINELRSKDPHVVAVSFNRNYGK